MLLLSFATAVAVTFCIAELMLISTRKVVFATFATPTVSDRWNARATGSTPIDEQSLTIYVGPEELIIGSAKSLTAPSPDGDLVVVPRATWKESLERLALANPAVRSLFPSRTVGLALSGTDATLPGYSEILSLVAAVQRINNRLGAEHNTEIATYFFDISSGFLGVN
jgi:hypothetical protein